MARENKLTSGVFSEIVGNSEKWSAYDKFLNLDHELSIPTTLELASYSKRYRDFISMLRPNFEKLAKLEIIIMQLRAKEMIHEEMKLSLVRDYIYARSIFYRGDKEAKDIRVIVGKTDVFGDDVESLATNEKFLALATQKLQQAMDVEIGKNIRIVEELFR